MFKMNKLFLQAFYIQIVIMAELMALASQERGNMVALIAALNNNQNLGTGEVLDGTTDRNVNTESGVVDKTSSGSGDKYVKPTPSPSQKQMIDNLFYHLKARWMSYKRDIKDQEGDFEYFRSTLLRSDFVTSKNFADTVKFLYERSSKYLRYMADLVSILSLDLSKCNQTFFAQEFSSKINLYVEKKKSSKAERKYLFKAISKILNKIHEYELENPRLGDMRPDIFSKLTPKAAYWLICLCGGGFFTSSVVGLWKAQNVKNAHEWILAVDPNENYVDNFILNLSRFGLTDRLKDDKKYFLQRAVDIIIVDSDEPISDTAILTSLFDSFLPQMTRDEIEYFECLLLDAYYSSLPVSNLLKNDRDVFACIAFILKYYGPRYGFGDSTKLPDIKIPAIPVNDWFADGVLSAELFFYRGIYSAIKFYQNSNWECVSAKDGSRASCEKTVNGKKLKVTLYRDTPVLDHENRIPDSNWDIRVHRGHSFTVTDTFPKAKHTFKGKLLFDGSCGSISNIVLSGFIENYPDNLYLGHLEVASGDINAIFLSRLMEGAARGNTSFEVLDQEFKKEFNREDLILPHRPALLVGPYVQMFEGS